MAHASTSRNLLGLARTFKRLSSADPLTQCLAPRFCRPYATETPLPGADSISSIRTVPDHINPPAPQLSQGQNQTPLSLNAFEQPIVATLYQFPSLEPTGYALYHPQFLNVPLRRDILHRAVIFEADGSRQGTASTKWRGDVHGSNRKILQQKGTGKARAGDKKSPIRRGGGVAFGPHPRDFSTELQAKVYAQAFRIALSYRYRKGELIILDNDISGVLDHTDRWVHNVLVEHNWSRGNGGTLVVTNLAEQSNPEVFDKMRLVEKHAKLKDIYDVDVKDLLEKRRIVIEKAALESILSPLVTGLPPDAVENMVRYVAKSL